MLKRIWRLINRLKGDGYSLKNDIWIERMAEQGMIQPFEPRMISKVGQDGGPYKIGEPGRRALSWGLGSYGYDLRLSYKEFSSFRHLPGQVVDPKRFNTDHLEESTLHRDVMGDYYILPGNSYGLGVGLEYLDIPPNVLVLCIGKSTYARCGIIANITPGEAGWKGHLTLEFSNSSPADCRMYAGEGVIQLLFFEGAPCAIPYGARNGKYQNQPESIVIAKV